MHAGIVNQPTAYEGNNYLLPTVAAVVLGGTSLLGGRGNLAATAVAALFLSQLDQFVLALGVTYATRTLVQAGALAVGVALYTIDGEGWRDASSHIALARSRRHEPRMATTRHVVVPTEQATTKGRDDRFMTKKRGGVLLALALACGAVMVVAATSSAKSTSSAKASAVPSWCGPKKIKLGVHGRLRREQLEAGYDRLGS